MLCVQDRITFSFLGWSEMWKNKRTISNRWTQEWMQCLYFKLASEICLYYIPIWGEGGGVYKNKIAVSE